MKTVMIVGDSWACGEWQWTASDPDGRSGSVVHPGTRQYLEEAGHGVIMVADPGASNWAQLDRLEPYHALQQPGSRHMLTDTDVILWFLTDPFRDLMNRQFLDIDLTGLALTGDEHQPRDRASYDAAWDLLMRNSLAHMARLAQGRPVLMVGGVAPVPAWTRQVYPEWRVVTEDWVRWLIPDSQASMTHNNRNWRYTDCDEELLGFHEQAEQQAFMFRWRAQNNANSLERRYWWPDGTHPNRLAHQRLTQELILPLL